MRDVDTNFIDYFDGSEPPAKGKDSVMAFLESFMNAFSDIKGDNLKTYSNNDGSEVVVTGDGPALSKMIFSD
jgi:hypothetical protein